MNTTNKRKYHHQKQHYHKKKINDTRKINSTIRGKKKRKPSLKKKHTNIYMNNIPPSQFKSSRKYLLHKCGLPDVPETSHCFNDETHHTCCRLSKKARDYADESGNPIGKLADDVFKKLPKSHHLKAHFKKTGERPWCTCFGSKVCGYYADNFKDTHIKFISNPTKKEYAHTINGSEDCEEFVRNKFEVESHGTPGIYGKKSSNNYDNMCKSKHNIKYSNY